MRGCCEVHWQSGGSDPSTSHGMDLGFLRRTESEMKVRNMNWPYVQQN